MVPVLVPDPVSAFLRKGVTGQIEHAEQCKDGDQRNKQNGSDAALRGHAAIFIVDQPHHDCLHQHPSWPDQPPD